MSFTLNVTFRGLCAFVSDEPLRFEGDQVISGMTVLLPDARQSRPFGSLTICAHEPQVTFDQPNGPDMVWDLDRERVELVGDLPAEGVGIGASLEIVPHLAEVVPEVGKIRDALLTQPESNNLVVASLRLTFGTIHGIEPSPIVMEFRIDPDIPGTYRGRFARAVQLLIPIEGDQCVFRAIPFGGGSAREVTLTPKPGRSSVGVTFSNLCRRFEEKSVVDADADFSTYYDLLEGYEGSRPIPMPLIGRDLQEQANGEVRGEATSGFGCFPARG